MLFFGSPKIDLRITLFLLGVSFVVSLIVLATAKRKFLVVVFSVLGNIFFFLPVLQDLKYLEYIIFRGLNTFLYSFGHF